MIKLEIKGKGKYAALDTDLRSRVIRKVQRDYAEWFERVLEDRFPDTPLQELVSVVQVQHWPNRVVLLEGSEAFATYHWPIFKTK